MRWIFLDHFTLPPNHIIRTWITVLVLLFILNPKSSLAWSNPEISPISCAAERVLLVPISECLLVATKLSTNIC
jgi:hypothetical protein